MDVRLSPIDSMTALGASPSSTTPLRTTVQVKVSAISRTWQYKLRWRVELFFKWIKQNLRIKHFLGTSENAVKTQVWIAVCVYVLAAIHRKEHRADLSLSQMLQIVSVNAFEQVPLAELFANLTSQDEAAYSRNQLMLWD